MKETCANRSTSAGSDEDIQAVLVAARANGRGAPPMKVHGHFPDQHRANMAQKVSFDETSSSNVVAEVQVPSHRAKIGRGVTPHPSPIVIV